MSQPPWRDSRSTHLLAALVGLAVCLTVVVVVWTAARSFATPKGFALRWYVAPRRTIPPGVGLGAADVELVLGRVPGRAKFVTLPERAIGRFTLRRLEEGAPITSAALSSAAPSMGPSAHLVVPVPVERRFALHVRPGQRVLLLRDTLVVPDSTSHALRVLALVTVGDSVTMLLEMPREDTAAMRALSADVWRPMVLRDTATAAP